MKITTLLTIAGTAVPLTGFAQSGSAYVNYVKQTQYPIVNGMPVERIVTVDSAGEMQSPLAIDPDGALFELYTIKNGNAADTYYIAEQFVGTYVPQAIINFDTPDPYLESPRTRADQPIKVQVTTSGIRTEANAPTATKAVDLQHHVQSYGVNGTTDGLDRTQATLYASTEITTNSPPNTPTVYTFEVNAVPGDNRAKVRGEERFTVLSKADIQNGGLYNVPAQVLASRYIQVWPVANGSITGLTEGQLVRFAVPAVNLSVVDAYPDSDTYAQVYKGPPAIGTQGIVVPGSAKSVKDTKPHNLQMNLSDYEHVFDEGGDGEWTMELLTSTPFGIDRLAKVTFIVDRTIQFNGSVTTKE